MESPDFPAAMSTVQRPVTNQEEWSALRRISPINHPVRHLHLLSPPEHAAAGGGGSGNGDESSYGLLDVNKLMADTTQLFAGNSGDPDTTLNRLASEMVAESHPVTTTSVTEPMQDGAFDSTLSGDETLDPLSSSAVVSEAHALVRALSDYTMESVEPSVASLITALSHSSQAVSDSARQTLQDVEEEEEEEPLQPSDWSRDVQRIASSLTGLDHYLSANQTPASSVSLAPVSAPGTAGGASSVFMSAPPYTGSPALHDTGLSGLNQVRMIPGQEGESVPSSLPFGMASGDAMINAEDGDRFPLPGQEHSPSGSAIDVSAGIRRLGEGEDSDGDQASLFRNYLNPSDAGLLLAQYIASQQQQTFGQIGSGDNSSGASSPRRTHVDSARNSRQPLLSPHGSSRVGPSGLGDSSDSAAGGYGISDRLSPHSLSGVSSFSDGHLSDDAQCPTHRTDGVGIGPNQCELASSMETETMEAVDGPAEISQDHSKPWLESLRQGPSGQPYDRPDVLGEVNVTTVVTAATASTYELHHTASLSSPQSSFAMSPVSTMSRTNTDRVLSPAVTATSHNSVPSGSTLHGQDVQQPLETTPTCTYEAGGLSSASYTPAAPLDQAEEKLAGSQLGTSSLPNSIAPLSGPGAFDSMLQGDASFYSQLGLGSAEQMDEDFVSAAANIGELLDADQAENALEYQFDPAFDTSFSGSGQLDFSQQPLSVAGGTFSASTAGSQVPPVSGGSDIFLSEKPSITHPVPLVATSLATPQKPADHLPDAIGKTFSLLPSASRESPLKPVNQSDDSNSSFPSGPSPSTYFAARSSVLGGLDDMSGVRPDDRPHFAMGHPLFSPPSAPSNSSAFGDRSPFADSNLLLVNSPDRAPVSSASGSTMGYNSSQVAAVSPVKSSTSHLSADLSQQRAAGMQASGATSGSTKSVVGSGQPSSLSFVRDDPVLPHAHLGPSVPDSHSAGVTSGAVTSNHPFTTAAGASLHTASAIFLSPSEILRQSYTLGQIGDAVAVPDLSLLSEQSDRLPVGSTVAQHAFPSAYLGGDSLVYDSRCDSVCSSFASSVSGCSDVASDLPSGGDNASPSVSESSVANEDVSDGSLCDSEAGDSTTNNRTIHTTPAGVLGVDATPTQLSPRHLRHAGIDMDMTPMQRPNPAHKMAQLRDDSSGVLSLMVSPGTDSNHRQHTDIAASAGSGTSLPAGRNGGVSYIQVSGLNYDKESSLSLVRAQVNLSDEVCVSLRSEVSVVQADVTASKQPAGSMSDVSTSRITGTSLSYRPESSPTLSTLPDLLPGNAQETQIYSSTVTGTSLQQTLTRFDSPKTPPPATSIPQLISGHNSPSATRSPNGGKSSAAFSDLGQPLSSPLPPQLRRIVQPRNIEKWLSELLQNSPQSNGNSPRATAETSAYVDVATNVSSPAVAYTDVATSVSSPAIAYKGSSPTMATPDIARSLSESFTQTLGDTQLGPVTLPEAYAVRGIQCVGVSVPVTIPVRNSGTKWLKASVELKMPDGGPLPVEMLSLFQVSPRITLGPLKSADIEVTCLPHAAGSFSVLLVLSLQPVISDGLAGGHLGHLVTTCVLSVNAIEAQLHVVRPPGITKAMGLTSSSTSNLIDAEDRLGSVMYGTTHYHPVYLRNPCSISLPLRLLITTDQSSFDLFSVASSLASADADSQQLASTINLSPPTPLTTMTTVGRGSIPPCQAGEYFIVWVLFKAPSPPAGDLPSSLVEYKCSVRLELDVAAEFPLASVHLSVSVGMAKLHAPRSMQALSFSSAPDKVVKRSIPLRNVGNMPCNVQLALSPPSALFGVQPNSIHLSPQQEVDVNISFLCSIAGHSFSSYLVMSIVENGNQYELMLRGTTSSPSVAVAAPEVTLPHVDVATSRSFLCCNCNQITFPGVPRGETRTEAFLLYNTSYTEEVLLELSIPQHDDQFKIILPPYKGLRSLSPAKATPSKQPSAKLGPQESMSVTIQFSADRLAAVKSSCLIRDLQHAMKFQVPLFAYGGKADVAALTGVHSRMLTKIRLGELAKQRSISKLLVENRGKRDGYVKILCYEGTVDGEIIPAECMAVSPMDSVIPAGKSKQFLLIVNPLACMKHPVLSQLCDKKMATLCLYSGDELARCRWRRVCRSVGETSSSSHASLDKSTASSSLDRTQPVCAAVSHVGLNRTMAGENLELRELSCYGPVGTAAEEEELFSAGVRQQKIQVIATLPGSEASKPANTDPAARKKSQSPAALASDVMSEVGKVTTSKEDGRSQVDGLEAEFNFQQFPPTPIKDAGKGGEASSYFKSSSHHMTDADWLVSPTSLHVEARADGESVGTVSIKNLSSKGCKFGVHWPGYLLAVSPDHGSIPARGVATVKVSLKLSPDVSYPPGTVLTFTCGKTRKDVVVNVSSAFEQTLQPSIPTSLAAVLPPTAAGKPPSSKPTQPVSKGKKGDTVSTQPSERTIAFPAISVGQTSASGISLHNVTSSVMKWQLISLRPAYVMPAGKSTFESQALYSAFVADSRFGSLDPLEKKEVYVTFQPRDVGTFSQLWLVEYTLPDHRGPSRKRKQQLLFSAKALPQFPLSDAAGKSLCDSSADASGSESQPLIGPLIDDTAAPVSSHQHSQPAPQDLSSVVKAKSVARPRDIASLVTVLKDSLEFSAESPHSVCTLKVSISNRAHQSLEMTVASVDAPFSVRSSHRHFTLRARSCVRLPVQYQPGVHGVQHGVLLLSVPSLTSHSLSVHLRGRCSAS